MLELLRRAPAAKPAVRYLDGRSVGYGELAAAAARVRPIGTGRGSVGLCLADPVQLVVWAAGLLGRGCSVFLLHPDLPAAEIEATAAHEGAEAVITADGVALRHGDLVRDAPGATMHFYTSGTSGHRKGAVRTARSLLVEGDAVAGRLSYSDETTVLCGVPLCHAYGFALGVLAVLSAGASVVAAKPMTGNQLAAAVSACGADVLVGVPVLFDMWSRGAPATAAGLRLCVSSGAALPDDVAARFRRVWGTGVAQQYGLTECGAISVDLSESGSAGCVGTPYPGVRVRCSGSGEVVVTGAHLARGYLRAADGSVAEFPADGLRTGDLGVLGDDGVLRLTGRRSEVINVHGEKVDPAEVEQALRGHPGVTDAAVVGVPTRTGADEWVAAFVVGDTDLAPRELAEICGTRLVHFKVPRRFVQVAALPRTATGKVRRTELRELLTRTDTP